MSLTTLRESISATRDIIYMNTGFTGPSPQPVLDRMRAVFEKRAGLLSVEACVKAHVARAQQHGAELRIGCKLLSWDADGDGVVVETSDGRVRASRLVITPGPWAPFELDDLGVPFKILRKSLFWYATDSPHHTDVPAFYIELPHGHFYCFPKIDARPQARGAHRRGRDRSAARCEPGDRSGRAGAHRGVPRGARTGSINDVHRPRSLLLHDDAGRAFPTLRCGVRIAEVRNRATD